MTAQGTKSTRGARRAGLVGVLLAVAAATEVVGAGTARANGRFPASNAVVFSPSDEDATMVRVTFGLLVTRDRGRSWRWICERAIGFNGPEDPSYVVTKSGAIVAGLFDGLRVSRDHGCSWDAVKTDATVFVDLTTRADGAIVALASSYDKHTDAGSTYRTQLYLSTDDARSFVALGPRLDPTLLAETVDVAPSDPARIYVSAVRGADTTRQGVLLISTDGGRRWTERVTALEPKELAPFIAAVDPKHADRIYLRTSASPENPTRLLVTDDAGKTYRRLLAAKGPLLGFALSPDGTTLHAGGPDDGLFTGAAGPAAAELAQVAKLKVQCLARSGETLWACSNEASGFIAGTSRDGGGTFQAQVHLRDIAGPIACAEGTAVARECGADWKKLVSELGLGTPTTPSDAGGGGDAGSVGKGPPRPALASAADDGALLSGRSAWMLAVAGAAGGAWLLLRARRRR